MKTTEQQNVKLDKTIDYDADMAITKFIYEQKDIFDEIMCDSFYDGFNVIQELKEMNMIQTAIDETIKLGKKLESYSNSVDTIEKLIDNTY